MKNCAIIRVLKIEYVTCALALFLCPSSSGTATRKLTPDAARPVSLVFEQDQRNGQMRTVIDVSKEARNMLLVPVSLDLAKTSTKSHENTSSNISESTTRKIASESKLASANTSQPTKRRLPSQSGLPTKQTPKSTIADAALGQSPIQKESERRLQGTGLDAAELLVESLKPMSCSSMTDSGGRASIVRRALHSGTSTLTTTSLFRGVEATNHQTSFLRAHIAIGQSTPSCQKSFKAVNRAAVETAVLE